MTSAQEDFKEAARRHKDADERCGRPWSCACAACIQEREGITKAEWLRRHVGRRARLANVRAYLRGVE